MEVGVVRSDEGDEGDEERAEEEVRGELCV